MAGRIAGHQSLTTREKESYPMPSATVAKRGAVAKRKPQAIQATPEAVERDRLADMIQALATNPDADVGKLEAVLALYERHQSKEARLAFVRAFSLLQGELPTIRQTGVSEVHGRFAKLEDIVEGVRPVLAAHGFSVSFKHEFPERMVKTVGTLSHNEGHAETTEFLGPLDESGRKNPTQAIASACSYGRRYCISALLNIASRGDDDDANGTTPRAANEPEEPEGFADWWTDIQLVAEQGVPALQKAWSSSKADYCRYVSRRFSKQWAAIKAQASKVAP
jgi:hypothetical protein